MTDIETTGSRVRWLRDRLGVTQAELARRLSVRQSYVSEIENNQATPSTQLMLALAEQLDTSVDFLLMRSDDPRMPADELSDEESATDLARDALLAEWELLDDIDQQALYQIAVTLRLSKERRKQRVIE